MTIRWPRTPCIFLHGRKPGGPRANALDESLALHAEHEVNASTFAARVIASTGSDVYSAISGAIGALRGPRHGGADEAAMDIIARYKNGIEAASDLRARVGGVIGFGHLVYTVADPYKEIIKEVARKLCAEGGALRLYGIAERIGLLMRDLKKMFPNLDWYPASAYHMMGSLRRCLRLTGCSPDRTVAGR